MSRAAIRYASAILSLAKDKSVEADVFNDMLNISQTFSKSEELNEVLTNSVVSSESKLALLKSIFSNCNAQTLDVFKLLDENNRLPILGQVASSFVALYKQEKGIIEASVITAVALTPELEQAVLKKAQEISGATSSSQIQIKNTVNPDILGGFILRVGDVELDSSISNKIQEMKRTLLDASLN